MKPLRFVWVLLFPLFVFAGCSQPPYQEARYIMGTLNEIQIYGLPLKAARHAADQAFQAMQQVDHLMSHYKESSEISKLNRAKARTPVLVSKETFVVLQQAQAYSQKTDGAFDITLAPLVKRWGFFDKQEKPIPTKTELDQLKAYYGYDKLVLMENPPAVLKKNAALQIDLGAIAKGYAVDLAIAALKRCGVQSASVNSGGNIGFLGLPPGKTAWPVGIKDPENPEQLLGTLLVEKGAVATSGNYEQFFEINGRRYTHILDPRTGWPVEGVLSVTVVAPTAMDADALSTALFVFGPQKGAGLAQEKGAHVLAVLTQAGESKRYFSGEMARFFTPENPR